MNPELNAPLLVVPSHAAHQPRALTLACELGVPCLTPDADPARMDSAQLALLVEDDGLALQTCGPKAPGPVRVDFLQGAVAHRRRFGGGAGQQIAKAIGIKGGRRPSVADVTAGLGRDGFVLATLGCTVTLVERSPVVASLLADGLARAQQDPEVGPIIARLSLITGDSIHWLEQLGPDGPACPDVIYLDPMFPHSNKTAQVKKEMRLFRDLVGDDPDAEALLARALKVARYRVVVKRPRKAPPIAGPEPGFRLEGKSGRFDIYPLRGFD
ncbi:class I SAM-dependent methyltransferase [Motiliproteus sp. SC1-56]|uniref:class I SAM-dependent methyltransferase n=1 Tax=Motiliproteus sp. SC1-56 TaxID=2799565 RepID=UPI00351C1905